MYSISEQLRVILLLLITITTRFQVGAQVPLSIEWQLEDLEESELSAEFDLTPSDSLELKIWLRDLVRQMHESGYLEASVDTLMILDDRYIIGLHRGPRYYWTRLDFSKIPIQIASRNLQKNAEGKNFHVEEVNRIFEDLLVAAENSGYPFASVQLDSLRLEAGKMSAVIKMELKQKIMMEPLRIEGDLQITRRYLEQLLDVRTGDHFNRRKITQLKTRLDEINFADPYRNPTVSFLGEGATINLYLNRKPANQFDILLGLIPSNRENERFRITGNVNIAMENQFGVGERFHMNFESLQPATQELELDFSYPFVFDLPFGTDLHFDLYKRDSTYIDLNYEIGIRYFTGRRSSVKFFVQNSRSNLLRIDSAAIVNSRKLPPNLDLSRSLFGVEFQHQKYDYRLNPRKGREIIWSVAAGRKRIRRSDLVSELKDPNDSTFEFSSLYNELDLNQFQIKMLATLNFFVPLFQSSAIRLQQSTGWIKSDRELYDNELFRIGGTKLLRGFNEESIRSNFFSILTIEYRLLFDRNSNLFVFSDIGYFRQHTANIDRNDTPVGLGIGMNLETKIGVFGISYAIGKEEGDPFNFRTGKIHFGMVSLF